MSNRFYVKSDLAPGPLILEGSEARHLAQVCRISKGETVFIFNGNGFQYRAKVIQVDKKFVQLEVYHQDLANRELGFSLTVGCPLPKGDRAHYLVEKLTELGVTEYVPIMTNRAVYSPGRGKLEKLRIYVIEASKQCGRNRLMKIGEVQQWAAFAGRFDGSSAKLLAQPGTDSIPRVLNVVSIVVAIGPEGGWTDEEISLGIKHGWSQVSLGKCILRVETAALALVAHVALS